jgi:hypothetical protein
LRFFREILTIAAGLVAVLLCVALAAPYFIDWNRHKPVIVDLLQKATGAKIVVDGDIDLKILPSPKLRLGNLRIAGQDRDAPKLAADTLQMELGLTALLRGEIRFVEAGLEGARIEVSMRPDGSLVLPDLPKTRPGQIAFEHVAFTDAHVTIARQQKPPLLLKGLSLEASGQSLGGPFRGKGALQVLGRMVEYSFNTGTLEGNVIRAKLVTGAIGPVERSEYDGEIKLLLDAGRVLRPSFTGTAVLSGSFELPDGERQAWRASGPLVATMAGLKSETIELRGGEEQRSFSATGSLEALFEPVKGVPAGRTAKGATLTLAAQQINLDALLAGDGGPAQAFARFSHGLQTLSAARMESVPVPSILDIDLTAAALTVGGETLTGVRLKAAMEAGKPAVVTFTSGAPGGTDIALSGSLETGIAPVFRGSMTFSTRDMRRLEQWLATGAPQAGRLAAAFPYRAFRLSGIGNISKAGFSARDLSVATGRSQFTGDVIFTRAVGKERARLHVDLASPALDIDGLGDLTAPASALEGVDFSIALDAKATRLARFGKGMIDAGRISVRLERTGNEVRLTQLDIGNLGGADLAATAVLSNAAGKADVELDAKNLVQLTQVLGRIAPGPWSQALAARAAALSPAKLTIRLRGTGQPSGKPGASLFDGLKIAAFDISGDLNGTQVKAASAAKAGTIGADGSLRLRAEKPAVLLRQLGLEALSLSGMGTGAIDVEWKGADKPAKPAEVLVNAQIAGTQLAFSGDARKLLPLPDLRGKVAITSKDAGSLLQLLAVVLPDAQARAPIDLKGDFAWRGARLSAGSLSGTLLGAKLLGHLALAPRSVDRDITRYHLTGDLRFDRLDMRGLASLVFGPVQTSDGKDALWSSRPFRPAAGDFPPSDLIVQAGQFDLPGGGKARNVHFDLHLAPGLMALNNMNMRAGDTSLNGRLVFRKDKETSALSGRFAFRAPSLGLQGIAGSAAGTVDFAATGNSELALVSGLAGRGSMKVKDLTLAGSDPRALQRVLEATDAERLELTESGVRAALKTNFDKAPLSLKEKTFAITFAGGAARFETDETRNLPGAVDGDVSATFDLRSLTGQAKVALTARERPKDWNGPLPAVTLERPVVPVPAGGDRKALADAGAPVISAASFVNGVSARAIVREVARMEALEFDIRERAWFSRRVKAAQFLAARQKEVEAYRIEQARLAEEARLRAEEEARRKAEEEAKRKAEEEKRKAEEARLKAEAERRQAAEDKRKLEEAIRKAAEEQARIDREEKRKAQQRAKQEADRRAREKARQAAEEAATQAKAKAKLNERPVLRSPGNGAPVQLLPIPGFR